MTNMSKNGYDTTQKPCESSTLPVQKYFFLVHHVVKVLKQIQKLRGLLEASFFIHSPTA